MAAYDGDAFAGKDCSITFSGFTASVRSISGPNMTRDAIDVSAMDSPDDIREKIPGMIDLGEVVFECVFDADETPVINGSAGTLDITWGDTTVWRFNDAFCTSYAPSVDYEGYGAVSVGFALSAGAGGITGSDVDFDYTAP